MQATVHETPKYRAKSKLLLSGSEREALRMHLAENPEIHDVIPGMGGMRKARWTQEGRGKGKRGGVRIVYFHAPSANAAVLLDIYSKNEREDLNNAEKKALRQTVKEIKRIIHKGDDAGGPPNPGRAN